MTETGKIEYSPDYKSEVPEFRLADKVPDEAKAEERIAELKAELTACRQSHVDVIENVIQRTFDAVLALPKQSSIRYWPDGGGLPRSDRCIRVSDIERLRKGGSE